MGHAIASQHVPFGVVGEFLGFIITKRQQPRAIKLRWLDQDVVIKIAKYLRDDRELSTWIPGMQVQVWGTQRLSAKRSEVKFKAHRLSPWKTAPVNSNSGKVHCPEVPTQASPPKVGQINPSQISSSQVNPNQTKPLVFKVCTKSDCMKRGGREICKMLDREVTQGSQAQPIIVQGTGCMGKCKTGPHLVVMPDKVAYSNLKSQDIPEILARHLISHASS